MPLLVAKVDGSWSKAGFSSNFGFVVVLSAKTGKVLDYQFLSKYCNQCNVARAQGKITDDQTCGNENCSVSSKLKFCKILSYKF